MATMKANQRVQIGSAPWITEERSSANTIADTESEEFSFSVRNDVDWLNEHMAEIFSENQVNVADIFKTPGKLRAKTPKTGRKANPLEARAPLSDVFSATPRGAPSPFKRLHFEKAVTTFQVAEDAPSGLGASPMGTAAVKTSVQQKSSTNPANFLDSGYYGSQAVDSTQPTQLTDPFYEPTQVNSPPAVSANLQSQISIYSQVEPATGERRSTESSFHSVEEEQSKPSNMEPAIYEDEDHMMNTLQQPSYPILESPIQPKDKVLSSSPQKKSPVRVAESVALSSPNVRVFEEGDYGPDDVSMQDLRSPSPIVASPRQAQTQRPSPQILRLAPPGAPTPAKPTQVASHESLKDIESPQSDGSSPVRPIVRKSSLNFASLPAREPLTSKKSIGNRVSRTSHLEQSRTSYYGRQTGGKSLGSSEQDDDDDMDAEEEQESQQQEAARLHNKTSTRRLQDQISMLGKPQIVRPPSKSITANGLSISQTSQVVSAASIPDAKQQEPLPQEKPPGAFPEDEEDSWIGPPTSATAAVEPPSIFSPRPQMTKSHTTDVMEDIHGKTTIGTDFELPKRGEEARPKSPIRQPIVPERTTSAFGHVKSASTSVLRSPKKAGELVESKPISVSNPHPTSIAESASPPKSPSRTYRGSPLKAAKDKFSSILKTSRGLFASSAAASAEAKSNLTSSPSRINLKSQPSMASLLEQPLYPDLNLTKTISATSQVSDSPSRIVRKTRASTEREEQKKLDDARAAKEAKEAKKLDDQLEKARQKVKDEARLFRAEQEKVAAMQKEVAAKQEQGRQMKQHHAEIIRPTRSSPRKTKAQLEAEGIAAAALPAEEPETKDVEMVDASQSMPPPSIPAAKSQIGRPPAKRPVRPAKDAISKVKPPTVIRVDTGSQRGHQYQPSTSSLSANLQESLSDSQSITSSKTSTQGTLRHKASTSSIQSKTSNSSFKSGATKALEAAARKKEQDELAMQKKRDAKLELERQRAAIREEEKRKEEIQRRQEAERQREIQREKERAAAAADAKKAASRQAMDKRRLELEKAKESRAPPPAIRSQPSAEVLHDKALPALPQAKAQRMNTAAPRSQDEYGRPINHPSTKAPPKRPLQQDTDEHHSRPAVQRNGPSYQQNEAQSKRRKTSENFEGEEEIVESHPKMSAPPIRQSSVRPKDVPTKSLFASGYANVPPTATNLQRSTLISQHTINQSKPTHPLDMTQISKAPIAFAGQSQQNGQTHKTPARPTNLAGKSAAKSAKSSPRYPNGENIVLQEINTDSEDEEEDDKSKFPLPAWAESPALKIQLGKQEGLDPTDIFGGPKELVMEEVFNKSKEKFHKFRARTSSANWSGEDRLTQDEIRKDVEARDKLRRQGFWSFDHMV